MKIDKSVFDAQELATWNALIAKAKVDEADEQPDTAPVNKSNEGGIVDVDKSASPELTAALARLETLEKSYEMREFTEIAKKYAPLGEKEEDLAKTLYEMKKSNEDNYNAYISILDKSLGLVEKSGLFTEIGKTAGGYGSTGGVESKIEAAASEIMKSDPSIDYNTAILKAWESNPELAAEYDAEYSR